MYMYKTSNINAFLVLTKCKIVERIIVFDDLQQNGIRF